MKNIVKDIEENCPECECNTEATIEFLNHNGDLSFTSDHYRDVWFFYLNSLKSGLSKKISRTTTIELFCISHEKFKHIQKWWRRTHLLG